MPKQKRDITEGYVPKMEGTKVEKGYTPNSNTSGGFSDGYSPKQTRETTTEAPVVKPGTKL